LNQVYKGSELLDGTQVAANGIAPKLGTNG
jgi:hypothetical protein